MRGPIEVMRPDGTVFRVEAPAVSAWWKDYRKAPCVTCTGSNQASLDRAARLLYRVEKALGSRLRAGPRYLVLPEILELEWPNAWFFYPSTETTPPYLVHRGGVAGAGKEPVRWDSWYRATDRMEKIILGGDAARVSTVIGGTFAPARVGHSTSAWPWLVSTTVLLGASVAGRRPGSHKASLRGGRPSR